MAKHLVPHNVAEQGISPLPAIQDGLNKRQVAELAATVVDTVLEEGNVFQVAEALAVMDDFVKSVRKDERYIFFLRDELVKHHGRLVTASGAKIEVCEAAVTYDYSSNAEWRGLDEQIRYLQEQKKALEEKLRKIAPGRIGVDHETGEVLEGAFKTSKSTYRITLAK
ncbi:MAG: hypothetical protein ICV51_07975 [Flavisolibacter sp.]|nr:hypothetical protein [Flavisolibacter sp.]MBD0287596.1 hypothetical protein [Flavisolibacter sp.]MBD0297440.1 hypothetical protein [Flavisolibacter sp.]MBD0368968.1 hypothetical protein [Flavisolibacter sp.]MBD0375549.1 hypothetical protein [Flavisolibacter sp.]